MNCKLNEAITNYWNEYYCKDGLCTLCGQCGIIHTKGIRTPAGVEAGRENYCICPNGQSLRMQAEDGG